MILIHKFHLAFSPKLTVHHFLVCPFSIPGQAATFNTRLPTDFNTGTRDFKPSNWLKASSSLNSSPLMAAHENRETLVDSESYQGPRKAVPYLRITWAVSRKRGMVSRFINCVCDHDAFVFHNLPRVVGFKPNN